MEAIISMEKMSELQKPYLKNIVELWHQVRQHKLNLESEELPWVSSAFIPLEEYSETEDP